jgi:hypothetical protein
VYRASDHNFPEYVSDEGLRDLNFATSGRCLLFVIHSPGKDWVDYIKYRHRAWANIFDQQTPELRELVEDFPDLVDKPVLEIDGKQRTIRQELAPPLDDFLLDDEVRNILDYFGCDRDEHPCLMLFSDLRETHYRFIDLRKWIGWNLPSLQIAFRSYLEGPTFSKALKEAGNV